MREWLATHTPTMNSTLSFFMTHLLPFRREGPISQTAEVHRALQGVLAFDRASVCDLEVRALHVCAERELQVRSLDRAGQLGFAELRRRVVARQLLAFLLQRHGRRAVARAGLNREQPFAGQIDGRLCHQRACKREGDRREREYFLHGLAPSVPY